MTTTNNPTEQIRALNDQFRFSFDPNLGRVILTAGVQTLPSAQLQQLLQTVKNFSDFNSDNNPYLENDMGRIELFDSSFFWKIDYLHRQHWQQNIGSDDPADVQKTLRIMTIMFTSEY
jgi:hypothetical protein